MRAFFILLSLTFVSAQLCGNGRGYGCGGNCCNADCGNMGQVCSCGGCESSLCLPGTYSNNVNSRYCDSCPLGYYCPVAGTVNPVLCPIGSYCWGNNDGYATVARPCPNATLCRNAGQILPLCTFNRTLPRMDIHGGLISTIISKGASDKVSFDTCKLACCTSTQKCVAYSHLSGVIPGYSLYNENTALGNSGLYAPLLYSTCFLYANITAFIPNSAMTSYLLDS